MNLRRYMDIAALEIGDQSFSRVSFDEMLSNVNRALLDVTTKFDILELEDDFDIPAGHEISFPDQLVRLIDIRVSQTPSDAYTFVKLKEMTDEEYDSAAYSGIPTGDIPTHYHTSSASIRLIPAPLVEILSGGIIRYYGVSDWLTADANVPIPDFMAPYLAERVVTYALESDQRLDEAAYRTRKWEAREAEITEKIEDRSADRRTSMRPESWRTRHRGHV